MKLITASQDLHSGRYGGIVRNALHEMARLVSCLHDADGRVAAPGFYDGVREPGEHERAEIHSIAYDSSRLLSEIGAVPHGEMGYSTLERLWLRPTLDVNGMWGGYTGAGSKTVIANEASAKITMRLVEGQDPVAAQESIMRHLETNTPEGVRLEFMGERGASSLYSAQRPSAVDGGIKGARGYNWNGAPTRPDRCIAASDRNCASLAGIAYDYVFLRAFRRKLPCAK